MHYKKIFGITALTGAILFSTANAAEPVERETNNQVALLQSLTLGHFDGSITVEELKTLGDIGLGTFDGLDGEMIVLDGVVYRAGADLKINVVEDKVTVPFANVTFFEKDFSVKLKNISNKDLLEEKLNSLVDKYGANSFYFVKIDGMFSEILIRSEKAQEKPYKTLVQALEVDQKEKTLYNTYGTIVGLYCPPYMSGLNTPGWHFHFISVDKTLGGHVLQLKIKSGEVQFDKTDNFAMRLPKKKSFQKLDLAQDLSADIQVSEQGKNLTETDTDIIPEEITETETPETDEDIATVEN